MLGRNLNIEIGGDLYFPLSDLSNRNSGKVDVTVYEYLWSHLEQLHDAIIDALEEVKDAGE